MQKIIMFGGVGILIVALMTILTSVSYGLNPGFQSDITAYAPDRTDACVMAQQFVLDGLKSPATAKFPGWSETDCRVSQRGRIWVVSSFVDSQNSFGALLRSDYTVEMIYYPATGNWTLEGFALESR